MKKKEKAGDPAGLTAAIRFWKILALGAKDLCKEAMPCNKVMTDLKECLRESFYGVMLEFSPKEGKGKPLRLTLTGNANAIAARDIHKIMSCALPIPGIVVVGFRQRQEDYRDLQIGGVTLNNIKVSFLESGSKISLRVGVPDAFMYQRSGEKDAMSLIQMVMGEEKMTAIVRDIVILPLSKMNLPYMVSGEKIVREFDEAYSALIARQHH